MGLHLDLPYRVLLFLLALYSIESFAPPAVLESTEVADPTRAVLQSLRAHASNPAEIASVELHQADLERAMDVQGLQKMGLVKNAREAVLVRLGMAYSDFGKATPYKQWILKRDGFKISGAEQGMVHPGKEMFAVLQGVNGEIWKDPALAKRKAEYMPLMELMMGGPVINPSLTYDQISSFTAATRSIQTRNGPIEVPKFPMVVGYMHEWQGVIKSYLDARDAIRENKGPLAGTVRSLADYRIIFESIYGHNGSGPSKEEYTAWFEKTHGRKPDPKEIPFWTSARETVEKEARIKPPEGAGIEFFEGSLQAKRYAGSERPNKYSLFHRIMDRVDGTIEPEKIYREIAHLGSRYPLIESYFGGNYFGVMELQDYTAQEEIPRLIASGELSHKDAEMLKGHIENQKRLAKLAFDERAKRTIFYEGDKIVPAHEALDRMDKLTGIGIHVNGEIRRFNYGGPNGALQDTSGKGDDFFTLFNEHVAKPAYRTVTQDSGWTASGLSMLCPWDQV